MRDPSPPTDPAPAEPSPAEDSASLQVSPSLPDADSLPNPEGKTHRAAVYERYGGPEVLEVRETGIPRLRNDGLLVRVWASGINPVDWKLRNGSLRPYSSATFPMTPGSDLAGEVLEVGSRVSRFQPGDPVFAMLPPTTGGACAELAAVPAALAAPMPENLSFEQAAAVPLAALTALQALREKGRLAPGMRVLVNGGSGGVGSFAIQIAHRLGATVTAVASGPNLDLLHELGADDALDYTREDFTRSDRVWDLVFDVVSNRSFPAVARVLSREGRQVSLLPSPGRLFFLLATHTAGWLGYGKRVELESVQARGSELDEIRTWIEAGEIRPVLHGSYPLEDIALAQRESETGHPRGKIVVTHGPRSGHTGS